MPQRKGYKQSPEHIEKRKRFGKDHPNWKGDKVSANGGRSRARRMFPKIGNCVLCNATKAERHHIDGNTINNDETNILIVCRKCHIYSDGRLEMLRGMALANQPKALAARVGAKRVLPYPDPDNDWSAPSENSILDTCSTLRPMQ